MPVNEQKLTTVVDIIESFDIDDITQLISDQIVGRNYCNIAVNHFTPIYVNYQTLMSSKNATDEELALGRERFNQILKIIGQQFDIEIDPEWLNDNAKDRPAITMAFYSFFVIDIYQNILDLLYEYIRKNRAKLYEEFKDVPSSSGTTIHKFADDAQSEVIYRNIYDICRYSLSTMTIESSFDYFEEGYVPLTIIRQLYAKEVIAGDFIARIHEIYEKDLKLRSLTAFDVVGKLRYFYNQQGGN